MIMKIEYSDVIKMIQDQEFGEVALAGFLQELCRMKKQWGYKVDEEVAFAERLENGELFPWIHEYTP